MVVYLQRTMSKDIKLHPEYGVNPTMGQCFWCGGETGEIALLGASIKGEAPRMMVLGYGECPKCTEQMSQGILFMEATDSPAFENQRPMQKDAYPTGRWMVVTESFVERFMLPDAAAQTLEARRCLLTPDIYQKILDMHAEVKDGNVALETKTGEAVPPNDVDGGD